MSPKYQDIIPPSNSGSGSQPSSTSNSEQRRSIRDIPIPERRQSAGESSDTENRTSEQPVRKSTRRSHKTVNPDAEVSIPVHQEHQDEHVSEPMEESYHEEMHASEPARPSYHIDDGFYKGDEDSFGEEHIGNMGKGKNWLPWTIGAVVLVFIAFIVSSLLAHATITITGTTKQIPLTGAQFTLGTSTDSAVNYDVITVTASTSTIAQATDKITRTTTKTSSSTPAGTKATGTVVIYNNYSSASQDLVKTTRLQTSDGLIYRITSDVTVPGQKTANGTTTPGSVTVTVEADQPGPNYNSGPKDFTIVGFKGTAKYTKFYGRSTGSLSGGALAVAPSTTTGTGGTIQDQLEASLQNQLSTLIAGQLPANFVFIPNSIIVSFNGPTVTANSDGTSKVTELANATVLILDKQSLIQQIIATSPDASDTSATLDASSTQLESYDTDFAGITVSLPSSTTAAALKAGTPKITLDGIANIKTVFNSQNISARVSNLSEDQAIGVIKDLGNVSTVTIKISPWWKKSLPSANKITINNN